MKLTDSGVNIAPLEQPTCAPLSGWQGITEANVKEIAEKMPRVTSAMCVCESKCRVYVVICL